MQFLDALDRDVARSHALDLRPHRLQQAAQVDDLGLARGIEQLGPALGEHCGHHRIFGRPDRHHRKGELTPGEPSATRRNRADIAGGDLDDRTHRLERFQVQIDRPVADRAAAGQRHRRLPRPRQHRPEHENRRAHPPHHVVGRGGREDLLGAQRHPPPDLALLEPLDLGRHAEPVEQMPEAVDVGQPRQIGERQLLVGEQRARQQGERGVLRPRDGNRAFEPGTADDVNRVHASALVCCAPDAIRRGANAQLTFSNAALMRSLTSSPIAGMP